MRKRKLGFIKREAVTGEPEGSLPVNIRGSAMLSGITVAVAEGKDDFRMKRGSFRYNDRLKEKTYLPNKQETMRLGGTEHAFSLASSDGSVHGTLEYRFAGDNAYQRALEDQPFVKRLIHSGETDEVEFKRGRGGVPASFWESYSAFANTDGGVIVLGVKDESGVREIEGLDNVDKIVAGVWNAANNHEKVSANVLANRQVYPVEVGGKRLVVVEVPRAARTDRPVYVGADVFKGTFRRNGEGDYHCSREAVEAMLRDRCPETADNCLLDEMTIADLDDDSVRRYRMIFQTKRPEHAWNKLSDEDFLCKIGAAKADKSGMVHPLLSGLLCFGDFVTIMGVPRIKQSAGNNHGTQL